ncbi:MAG: (2Fe-2S)-binding protein [Lachnoclostridium sp.]|nr:(2Fe-2S)-binding protein [Lachnoclostridium sp.]
MKLEDVVCNCFGVTNEMIKDAVDSGATNLEEIQATLDVGNACGACLDEVQRSIDYFVTQKTQMSL